MIDGLISLLLSGVVKMQIQPWLDALTADYLARGYALADFQAGLIAFEFATQALAFIAVFGLLKAGKHLIRRLSD